MGLFSKRKAPKNDAVPQFTEEEADRVPDTGWTLNDALPLEPKFPNEPLPTDHKFELSFQSISMTNGHAGHQVYYDPRKRQAVQETWCATDDFTDPETGELRCVIRKSQEYQPIPRDVTTSWELWHYLRKKQPGWTLDRP